LRGMRDVAEPEIWLYHHLESTARRLYHASGFKEVRTPLLESTQLFKRGVGETTDIVEKEMYTFEDRNGESISLRPEGTASIVRALLEHNWINLTPVVKIYYMGPMFRHERPQKGRFRQHTQFGLEIFGVEGPDADVEIMATQHFLFQQLGLKDLTLKVTSIGDQTCRPAFREKLLGILKPRAAELCADCQKRLDRNPLRVFDCKNPGCQAIAKTLPTMMDNLCEPCKTHFQGVEQGLKALKIPYEIDPRVVRGIDYYTRTSFEFITDRIGAQGTVCGGGRYDLLVKELGGPNVPAVGCGMGEERLGMLVESLTESVTPKVQLYCVLPDPTAKDFVKELVYKLRNEGHWVDFDLQGKSMKSQFKSADRVGAKYALIIGGTEYQKGEALLRNMKDGTQETVPLSKLENVLKERLK
ncbi:MAG TPA: histidine--tRNA ligase, partial [Bdellovibrionales bacterium]|nr:histidine--tRNA ligase [Bdellovibrionales bacterium]